MRKIKLEIYKAGHKQYSIPVGFSQYLTFEKKKDAESFLRKYRIVIETSVRSLSIQVGQMYALYRMYYFQLDNYTSRHINESFNTFNGQCDYIFKEYSIGNSSFVFKAIEVCFNESFEIIRTLKEFGVRNKEYALKYQVFAIQKTMDGIYSEYHQERKSMKIKAEFMLTEKPVKVLTMKKAN